jgi:DNA-binding CsgD family transcriptional regulator
MEDTIKKVRIIELRKKGYNINEIVKELGCAKSTVSYHINKIGLGGVRYKFLNGIDNETIDKIIKLRNENKTYKEILELIDISEDKLIKICRINGINSSSSKFKNKNVNSDEIISFYLTVNSLRETGKHFNLSRETIRKYIPDDIFKENKLKKIKVSKTDAVISWRKRVKIKLVEYHGGKCEKCGYNKCIDALQFHHKDSNEKDFTIGGKSYSLERLKKESDKCILLCSNCHIEIHHEIKIVSVR